MSNLVETAVDAIASAAENVVDTVSNLVAPAASTIAPITGTYAGAIAPLPVQPAVAPTATVAPVVATAAAPAAPVVAAASLTAAQILRNTILAVRDLKTEVVPVPEWGVSVTIGVMPGTTRDAFVESVTGPMAASLFRATLLAYTIVDEAGKPVFTLDDVAALQKKSPDVTSRLVDVALQLNKMGQASVDAAAKN
jgi:hypothetical protein